MNNPVLDMVRNVVGTAPRIAQACGISRESVWQWRQVPARHVLIVEQLLKIPRHRIRPDLYPPIRLTKKAQRLTRQWINSANGRKQHGGKAA